MLVWNAFLRCTTTLIPLHMLRIKLEISSHETNIVYVYFFSPKAMTVLGMLSQFFSLLCTVIRLRFFQSDFYRICFVLFVVCWVYITPNQDFFSFLPCYLFCSAHSVISLYLSIYSCISYPLCLCL